MANQQDGRFEALDAWRGIAALGVAAFHFSVANHLYGLQLIRNASPYVDFFFVLSGFVITHSYALRIGNKGDVAPFLVRRFGRLWPLHAFTLLCLIALESVKLLLMSKTGMSAGEAPFTGEAAALAIPAHLAFLQAVGLFPTYTWNGPSWSIGCEFWTYLLFALACWAGVEQRRKLAVSFMIISAIVLTAANGGKLGATYDLGQFRCVLGFFAGVLTYDVFSNTPRPAFSTGMELSVAALGLICIATDVALTAVNPFYSFLPILIFPVLIYVFAQQSGGLSRWLLNTPAQLLGKWSYSIYLVHFVVLTVVNSGLRVIDRLSGSAFEVQGALANEPKFAMSLWVGDAMFAVYLATVIGLSALTWRYVEEPCRLYFNAIARRRKSLQASAYPRDRSSESLESHS